MTPKTMIQSPHVASSQSVGVGGRSHLQLPVQRLLWSISGCGLSHLHTVCAPVRCVMAKYLFTVALHHPRVSFLLIFFSFLQLCFSCSSPQNRFSSKIAIKSLWKFMSIVAAIASRLLLSCSLRRASSLCWSSGFCVVGCGGEEG